VVREDRPGDRRLVAYVAPAGQLPAPAELREGLVRTLPAAMIPAVFVELPVLPHLPSGKLDRRALAAAPPPEASRQAEAGVQAAPRTAVEELLAGLWMEILGAERIGIDDSFFDLGGHSLLAVQVIAAVRSWLGIEVPLRRLFEAPTVAAFGRAVVAAAPDPERLEETARLLLEVAALSEDEASGMLAAEDPG